MKPCYSFDGVDMGISYQDAGPWRSYELTSFGNTFAHLIENATVTELDHDGGEIRSYGLIEAPGNVAERACQMIDQITGRVTA